MNLAKIAAFKNSAQGAAIADTKADNNEAVNSGVYAYVPVIQGCSRPFLACNWRPQ